MLYILAPPPEVKHAQYTVLVDSATPPVDNLDDWIQRACSDHVAVDVRHFAQGLITDLPAIRAAVALPWSNGQTEGQINRLKLLKREMYGRAKLDLLSQRVLIKTERV